MTLKNDEPVKFVPTTISTNRFFGSSPPKKTVPKAVIVRKKINFHIESKYQNMGTRTESKKLQNVIFVQNSKYGALFVPKEKYGIVYWAFVLLDRRIHNRRLTMKLYHNRIREKVRSDFTQSAQHDAAVRVPNLIKDLKAYTILKRSEQIWPSASTLQYQNVISALCREIQELKEASIIAKLKDLKVPRENLKQCREYPEMKPLQIKKFENNHINILHNMPYFATSITMKEVPGFVKLHFNGSRELTRVNLMLKIVDSLVHHQRPCRRQAYRRHTARKNVKQIAEDDVCSGVLYSKFKDFEKMLTPKKSNRILLEFTIPEAEFDQQFSNSKKKTQK